MDPNDNIEWEASETGTRYIYENDTYGNIWVGQLANHTVKEY